MSISEHERQVLESIESDLACTGPKLASMLAIFARLTAGEEMPVRERVRRAFDTFPAAGMIATRAEAAARPAPRRRPMVRLRRQSAWMVWMLVAIAGIAWSLTFGRGAAKSVCPVTRTAACLQVHVPATPLNHGRDRAS